MNIRKASAASLALLGGLFTASVARAQVTLPVPQIAQTEGNWCWATSGLAVLQYRGQTAITECQVADWLEAANGWADTGPGKAAQPDPTYCCDHPDNCDFTEDYPGVTGLLGNFDIPGANIGGSIGSPPLTFAQIQAELGRGSPIVYGLAYTPGPGGHVEVINGTSTPGGVNTVEMMNPAGGAYEMDTYTEIVGGTGYNYYWDAVRTTETQSTNGNSTALTYRQGATQSIYNFAPGVTDFWVNYTTTNPSPWHWANQGSPGVGMVSAAAVTYASESTTSTQNLLAFGIGSDGTLQNNYWNGAGWWWSSLGAPSGVSLGGYLSAVAYMESSPPGGNVFTVPRINVFGISNHRMYRDTYDGSAWSWHDQGVSNVCSSPSAVTLRQNNTNAQGIDAFYVGCDGHMWRTYSMDGGGTWSDEDLGAAPGSTVGEPSSVAWHEAFGDAFYNFVVGSNGHLYLLYYNKSDGAAWTWSDISPPSGVTLTAGSYDGYSVSATSYRESSGTQRVHAFVYGTNGHLYDRQYNGSSWSWADLGTPGVSVIGGLQSTSYLEPGTSSVTGRVTAFVRGSNDHIYADAWNGSSWTWTDQAAPSDVQNR